MGDSPETVYFPDLISSLPSQVPFSGSQRPPLFQILKTYKTPTKKTISLKYLTRALYEMKIRGVSLVSACPNIQILSPALVGVAQWIECWPVNQMVTSLIPSQGTCLGCGSGPQ